MRPKIEKGEDSVFIIRVISWYHFLGCCAFLESCSARENKSNNKIYISIGEFFSSPAKIPKEKLYLYANEVEECYGNLPDAQYISAKHEASNIFILSNTQPLLSYARKIRSKNTTCVMYEEGIGTYASFFSLMKIYINERATQFHGNRLGYAMSYFYHRLLLPCLQRARVRGVNIYKHHMFNSDLSENSEVIESYKRALKAICSVSNSLVGVEKKLLFVSVPFIELGLVDRDTYYSEVEAQINKIVKAESLGIWVKPHPIENWSASFGDVVDNKVAIEEFYLNNKKNIQCVLAFNSTSVYTLALLFNVRSIRLLGVAGLKNSMSKSQLKILNRYSDVIKV